MKHDNEWLNRLYQNGSYENLNCEPFYLVESVQDACKDYHEHMTRWRQLSETPDQGERIEVQCHFPGIDPFSEVDFYDDKANTRAGRWGLSDDDLVPLIWRSCPIGKLPEGFKA